MHHFWPQLIAHATLLHGVVPDAVLPSTDYAFIGQAWSISLEWQFYLLAPLFYKWISEKKIARVALLSFTLIALGYLYPGGVAFLPKSAYLFFAGIASYYGYRFVARQKTLLASSAAWVAALPPTFALLWTHSVPLMMFSLVYSLVLASVLLPGNRILSTVLRFFECAPLLYLGRLSYCIYLTHMILLYVCAHFLSPLFQSQWAFFIALLASILVCVLPLSALLSQYVEYPLLNFGKGITAKRTLPGAGAFPESRSFAMKARFRFSRFLFGVPFLLVSGAHAVHAPTEYKPAIPHASHITMMLTDYRSRQIPSEYQWTGAHYDYVMSGNIDQYRKYAPGIQYYVYALNLTVIRETKADHADSQTVYYGDMQKWYAAHPQYNLEDAFIHDGASCPVPQPKTEGCRIQTAWGEHARWVINPGDPGLRVYNGERLRRITTHVQGTRYSADGVFFDEHGSGDFSYWRAYSIREYPSWSKYQDDVVELLAYEHKALGKIIQINTAESINPFEQRMIVAAGAVHMELLNNPFSNEMRERWAFIDAILRQGVFVEMVNAFSWTEINKNKYFPHGNESSPATRLKMAELCNYYMVVPHPASNLAMDMTNDGWDQSYAWQWIKAIEVDLGKPLGPRAVAYQGNDHQGKPLQVWFRDFERAMVFIRPQKPWDYVSYGRQHDDLD